MLECVEAPLDFAAWRITAYSPTPPLIAISPLEYRDGSVLLFPQIFSTWCSLPDVNRHLDSLKAPRHTNHRVTLRTQKRVAGIRPLLLALLLATGLRASSRPPTDSRIAWPSLSQTTCRNREALRQPLHLKRSCAIASGRGHLLPCCRSSPATQKALMALRKACA
jgi:hypothetical protein